MATHSSILAWRIPGTEEPAGLPSMGLHRVRHDWSDSSSNIIGKTFLKSNAFFSVYQPRKTTGVLSWRGTHVSQEPWSMWPLRPGRVGLRYQDYHPPLTCGAPVTIKDNCCISPGAHGWTSQRASLGIYTIKVPTGINYSHTCAPPGDYVFFILWLDPDIGMIKMFSQNYISLMIMPAGD